MRKDPGAPTLERSYTPGILPPVLLTVAVHALFIVIYIAAYGGDPSALVCAGAKKIGRWPFELIRVGFPTGGYDGQFYYALARNPWTLQSWGIIDFPPYRHLRILYPALAWLFSAGDAAALLWVMPAINLAAIASIAWCGALLAVHYRRSAWWGFLLPLVVNAGMPALRDLTDPLATATLCLMFTAYLLDGSVRRLALWAAAALLSREQNVAIVLLFLGDALLRRRWLHSGALAAALLLWFGWFSILRFEYGVWPVVPETISLSLAGIRYGLTHLSGAYGRSWIVNYPAMALIFLQIGICATLLASRARRMTASIAVTGIALALAAGIPVYLHFWSYSRVSVWMPLAIWLWSMQSGRRWPVLVLTPTVLLLISASLQPWIKG